jgi:nicotinamide mononucleotide transporter
VSLDAVLDAARPLLAPAFTLWGSPATWLEVAAFAMAIAMVLANLRVNPVAWPLAIGSSLLYALLFADSRLYGEATLQLFFVAVALWGWWQWLRGTGDDGAPLRVHVLSARARWGVAAATLAAWPVVALLLDHATDSDVPWLDALPTVASVTGQLLLGRKLVENWPVWLAVNLVSVVLFAVKGLWLTVLLYAIFAVLSVVGWRAWRRLARG